MIYDLLWIESLAFSLLLVATTVACVSTWRRRRLRTGIAIAAALLPLLVYAALVWIAGVLQFGYPVTSRWFYPLLFLTICYSIGSGWTLLRGLRSLAPSPPEFGSPEPGLPGAGLPEVIASTWPRGRLAMALAIAGILHWMTFWNADLAMRQRLSQAQAEADTCAASVVPPRVPDKDNAARVYERALAAMGASEPGRPGGVKDWREEWDRLIECQGPAPDPADPLIRSFLQGKAQAILLLREAASKPACWFEHDFSEGMAMRIPEAAIARSAMRILSLSARFRAAGGDARGALADLAAVFRLSENLSDEAILVAFGLAVSIDSVATRCLSAVLSSAEPSAQDLEVLSLDEAFSHARNLQRACRIEEAAGLATIAQISWEPAMVLPLGHLQRPLVAAAMPFYRVFLMEEDIEAYQWILGEHARIAAEPYYRAAPKLKVLREKLLCRPCGPFTIIWWYPAFEGSFKTVANGDAWRALARVLLAMHRFRTREGKLAESLEQLAPYGLDAVPVDPFDGAPLRLLRKGDALIAYSVGPDLVDQEGAPYDPDHKTGDLVVRLALFQTKKGGSE